MDHLARRFKAGLRALAGNLTRRAEPEAVDASKHPRGSSTAEPHHADSPRPHPGRAKRVLKRVGRYTGYVVLGLVGLLVVVVWRPEWFLTPSVLTKLTVKFGEPYHLKFKEYRLAIESRSFLKKEVTLKTRGFCLHDSTGTINGCFDKIDADLTVKLGLGVTLAEVDHLDVATRYLVMNPTKAPPLSAKDAKKKKKKGSYQSLDQMVPSSLRDLHIREIGVDLSSFTYNLTSTSSVSGDLSVTFSTAQSPPLALDTQLYYDTPEKSENLYGKLGVDSDLFTKGDLTFLRATGRLRGDVEDSASFDARIDQKSSNETVLSVKTALVNGTRKLRAGLDGSQTPDEMKGHLTALLTDSSGTIRELAVRSCDAEAPLSKHQHLRGLKVDCRLTALPKPYGKSPQQDKNKIAARLTLDAKVSNKLGHKDHFDADMRLAIGPVKDWYEFSAGLSAKLGGRVHDLPASLESKHDIDASLKVAKFQDLVKYLQDTAYAIPAPLHVLDGPVSLVFKSKGDTSKPDQLFTYTAATDLTSGKQKVIVAVDGKVLAKDLFTPGRKFDDKTEVKLKQVALELPYLKLGTVPAVTVDSRIRTGEEPQAKQLKQEQEQAAAEEGRTAVEKSTPSNVTYVAHVVTGSPIIIYTNLNPNPIPIAVDLKIVPLGQDGTVTVQPFVAEIFKRKADVDHVTLTMQAGAKQVNMDGLIKVKMPDADVSIKLLGSTDKPQVIFESDPPMNQQDIVAMLLFGKTPDDLDPDQKTTASNSQSGMASGAFGLASLYLFASTPIQYVGYDPATQSYAMKFSLPGGASLEVGSGAQQQGHLTLRKRLARHWVIQTEVERGNSSNVNGAPTQQDAVTTFLEWFQRY